MLWCAHGDRAPSAKRPHDIEFLFLCLDLHKTPDEVRRINPRDLHRLMMANEGRKLGKRQIAMSNKLDTNYSLEL